MISKNDNDKRVSIDLEEDEAVILDPGDWVDWIETPRLQFRVMREICGWYRSNAIDRYGVMTLTEKEWEDVIDIVDDHRPDQAQVVRSRYGNALIEIYGENK